jgi:hypothetical protein
MEQRIERNLPPSLGRAQKLGRMIGGLNTSPGRAVGETSVEEIEEIEARGFEAERVQEVIDRLSYSERIEDQAGAAILRGAFNDLLARIPDIPAGEGSAELNTAV